MDMVRDGFILHPGIALFRALKGFLVQFGLHGKRRRMCGPLNMPNAAQSLNLLDLLNLLEPTDIFLVTAHTVAL